MSINSGLHAERSQDRSPFTIVLFGRRCAQTMTSLRRILNENLTIAAIFIPSPRDFGPQVKRIPTRTTIPIARTAGVSGFDTVDNLASPHGVPIYEIRQPISTEVERALAEVGPDLVVVSCFPWRVPPPTVCTAREGAINLHPSLLPSYRGPDPLFWALRTGAVKWGVSVHRVTGRFDSGPIVRQQEFELTQAIIEPSFETAVGEIGADTLVAAITDIRTGIEFSSTQDESSATYFGFPTDADLTIEPQWTVGRALRFVRGIAQLGYQPTVKTERGVFTVKSAQSAIKKEDYERAARPSPDRVNMQLSDGLIELTLESVDMSRSGNWPS